MKLATTAAIAVAALALPGVASAATLQVPAACLEQNKILPIVGTGFTPNASVRITGAATPVTAFTDAAGNFGANTTFLTPANNSYRPQAVTLTATDETNPALAATASFEVSKLGSNFPTTGRLSDRTTWQFAGFTAGKTIYGHFRYRGQTIVNYRFGKAKGACGSLSVRARRLPARPRRGKWSVQIDMRKTYSRRTLPRATGTFTVF